MTGRHVARRSGDVEPAQRKRPKRVVENDEYAAAIIRMLIKYAPRLAADPAGLVYLDDIEEALRACRNLAIYGAHERVDQPPYSYGELAKILGVTRPAVVKRKHQGEDFYRRLAGPVVRLADLRAARARRLARAGVEDKTGTARELAAGGSE